MNTNKTPEHVMKEFEEEFGSLAGVEFIRAAVRFFGNRNEWSNDNKSPMQLLADAYKFFGVATETEQEAMLNEEEPAYDFKKECYIVKESD